MAITDYSSLQSEIADWSHRSDLATKIPTFIQLAEAKLSTQIRDRKLEVTLNDSIAAGGTYTLPADYDGIKSLTILSNPVVVCELIPDHILEAYNQNNTSGVPRFYSITNNTVNFNPYPDNIYQIKFVYYQMLPSLSSVNTTNWVLTRFPYAYLYGSLVELGIYTQDESLIATYQSKFEASIEDIFKKFNDQSFSGSPLRSRSDYVVDYYV